MKRILGLAVNAKRIFSREEISRNACISIEGIE